MASLVQWARSGTSGRVTSGERDAQLGTVVTRSRRHSSPSDHSSEPTDPPSSAVNPSHEQAQQLGAPPGLTEVEISKSPLRGSSSLSPPTPGRVGPEGRRTMAKLVEELEAAEFVDATATTAEVGYLDNEFTPMWWKDAGDRRVHRVWAVKDGDKVLMYFFNNGMQTTSVSGLKRGHERAIKEQTELQQAGGQLNWPTGYVAMCDRIYSYLTEYRRATGHCPSAATWQQA